MIQLTIKTDLFSIDIDLAPSADLIACVVPAFQIALPHFLNAFDTCIAQPPATPKYNPGDRTRCP